MKMTIRDLIQFLLLHTDLDDTFYGFLLTKNDVDEITIFDDDDILKWLEEEKKND